MENPSPAEVPPEPLVEQHEPGVEAHAALPTGYYYYDPALWDLYPGENDQSVVPGWCYYDPSQAGGGSDWPYRGMPPRHMLYDPSLYEGAADTTTQPSDVTTDAVVEARGPVEPVVPVPEPETFRQEPQPAEPVIPAIEETPQLEPPPVLESVVAEPEARREPEVEETPSAPEPVIAEPEARREPEVEETPRSEPTPPALEPVIAKPEARREPEVEAAPQPELTPPAPEPVIAEPEARREPEIPTPPAPEILPEHPEPTAVVPVELPTPESAVPPTVQVTPDLSPSPVVVSEPRITLPGVSEERVTRSSVEPNIRDRKEAARPAQPTQTPERETLLVSDVAQEPREHVAPISAPDTVVLPVEPSIPESVEILPVSPTPETTVETRAILPEDRAEAARDELPAPVMPPTAPPEPSAVLTEQEERPASAEIRIVSTPDQPQEDTSVRSAPTSPEVHELARAEVSSPDETVALSPFSFLGHIPARTETVPEPPAEPVRSDLLAPSPSSEPEPISPPVPATDPDTKEPEVPPTHVQPTRAPEISEAVSERPAPASDEPVAVAQADLLPAEALQTPGISPVPTVSEAAPARLEPTAPEPIIEPVATAQADLLPAEALQTPEISLVPTVSEAIPARPEPTIEPAATAQTEFLPAESPHVPEVSPIPPVSETVPVHPEPTPPEPIAERVAVAQADLLPAESFKEPEISPAPETPAEAETKEPKPIPAEPSAAFSAKEPEMVSPVADHFVPATPAVLPETPAVIGTPYQPEQKPVEELTRNETIFSPLIAEVSPVPASPPETSEITTSRVSPFVPDLSIPPPAPTLPELHPPQPHAPEPLAPEKLPEFPTSDEILKPAASEPAPPPSFPTRKPVPVFIPRPGKYIPSTPIESPVEEVAPIAPEVSPDIIGTTDFVAPVQAKSSSLIVPEPKAPFPEPLESIVPPAPALPTLPAANLPLEVQSFIEPVSTIERDLPVLIKPPAPPSPPKPATPSRPSIPEPVKPMPVEKTVESKAPPVPVTEPVKPIEPTKPILVEKAVESKAPPVSVTEPVKPIEPVPRPEPARPMPVDEEVQAKASAPPVEAVKPAGPEIPVQEKSQAPTLGTEKPVPDAADVSSLMEDADAPTAIQGASKSARPPNARFAPIGRSGSMTIQARPPMTPIKESARSLVTVTEPGKLVLDTPPPPAGKVEAVPMQFQPRYAPARAYPRSQLSVPILLVVGLGCLGLGYLGGYFTPRTGTASNSTNSINGRPDVVARQSAVNGDSASPVAGLTKVEQSDLDKAFTASKAGNLPEARQLFIELQKKHPEWPSMAIEVGRINLYLKDLTAAHDILTAASDRGAMPSDANFLLGLLYMTNQSFQESEAAFAKATALDPARPDFYYFWGECLRRDGKPMEALERFRAAMLRNQYETADGLYRLKYWLSKIQADQENTDDTNPQIDEGLKQARPAMEVLFAAAARAIKGKDYVAAVEYIRRARLYVEPSIYAVIMQDPTFIQESLRPEFAEFFKRVAAAPANPDADNAAAAAGPAGSVAPAPAKPAASPGKGR